MCSSSTLLPGPVLLVIATLCAFTAHPVREPARCCGHEGSGGRAPVELWASLCSSGPWCGLGTAAWTSCANSSVSLGEEGTGSLSWRYLRTLLKGCGCVDGHLIKSNAQLETAMKNCPETSNHSFQCHVKKLSISLRSFLL